MKAELHRVVSEKRFAGGSVLLKTGFVEQEGSISKLKDFFFAIKCPVDFILK